MQVFALPRSSCRDSHAWKDLYVDSAWIGDCHLCHVVYFLCILARLVMCYCRIFGLGIFEIVKRCQFLPSLGYPCAFLTRRETSTWAVRGLKIISSSLVLLHPRAFSAVPQSCLQSRDFLKGASFAPPPPPPIRTPRVFLTRLNISTLDCHLVSLHPRARCQLWPSLGSPCVFLTRGKICTWTVRELEIVTYIM